MQGKHFKLLQRGLVDGQCWSVTHSTHVASWHTWLDKVQSTLAAETQDLFFFFFEPFFFSNCCIYLLVKSHVAPQFVVVEQSESFKQSTHLYEERSQRWPLLQSELAVIHKIVKMEMYAYLQVQSTQVEDSTLQIWVPQDSEPDWHTFLTHKKWVPLQCVHFLILTEHKWHHNLYSIDNESYHYIRRTFDCHRKVSPWSNQISLQKKIQCQCDQQLT